MASCCVRRDNRRCRHQRCTARARDGTLLPTLMLVLVACGFSARCRYLPWYGLSCLFTRVLPERGAHIHGVVGGYRLHVERRSRWFACLCRVLFVYTFIWTFQDQVQVLRQTLGGFVGQVYSILQKMPVVDCSVCQMKGRVVIGEGQ